MGLFVPLIYLKMRLSFVPALCKSNQRLFSFNVKKKEEENKSHNFHVEFKPIPSSKILESVDYFSIKKKQTNKMH